MKPLPHHYEVNLTGGHLAMPSSQRPGSQASRRRRRLTTTALGTPGAPSIFCSHRCRRVSSSPCVRSHASLADEFDVKRGGPDGTSHGNVGAAVSLLLRREAEAGLGAGCDVAEEEPA